MRRKFRTQLGKFLREQRSNLALVQFARKLGISDCSLQRLETGKQNVTLDTLKHILSRLGYSVVDVFCD